MSWRSGDWAIWRFAGSLVASGCLAAALIFGCGSRTRHPNVLLISIDTLRADHLGCYGYAGARTPNIDGLAARGVRFTDAATVAPLTLPAHASLLTGTFPAFHGIRDNGGFYLPAEQVTLAETLHDAGYRTGGFVGAFVLDSRWGLRQGFDRYVDNFDVSQAGGAGMDRIQHPGNEVADRALEWIGQQGDQPFFAWVHFYDPHAPYTPPEPVAAQFPRTLAGSYDAEIAWTDVQVGRLIAHLTKARLLDDTIIVVVGDHGESLGEHQEQEHGFFVYDAALRIPFIAAGAGLTAAVVRDQVRIVDVMPTTLDLLGVPAPKNVQGQSLLPLVKGRHLDLLAFAETWYPRLHYGWSELMAVRDGRYKFVLAPKRELYDTRDDPGETRNLAAVNPARADALEGALGQMLARTTGANASTAARRIDPEAEERLRALGYVAGRVAQTPAGPRADPKDKVDLHNLLRLAAEDLRTDRADEAGRKLAQVLAADDRVVEAHTLLGDLHLKAQRHREAADAYRRALAVDPAYQRAAFNLAVAYKSMGRLDDARTGFERARQLDPRGGTAQFELADLAMRRGEYEAASALLNESLPFAVDRPAYLVKLAECEIELKQYDEAAKRLREALGANPNTERAHYDLGLLHEARGDREKAKSEYEAETARRQNYSASFNLAKLLARAGRHADAIGRYRESVAANPQFGAGYLYLAKELLDAGDLEGAERAARTGLKINADREVAPLGHYVLADVYNRLGRSRDADRELQAARLLEKR